METRKKYCLVCSCSSQHKQRLSHTRDRADISVWECLSCGLVRLSSFDHISEDFYRKSHMHTFIPCESHIIDKMAIEDAARRYHDFYPYFRDKNLLDFGCGDGGFLALAKNAARNVVGMEPDLQWTQRYRELRLQVLPCLEDLRTLDCKFEVVTMFHVFEHIPDPQPLLEEIRRNLSDGFLIIEVPSASDILLTLYECSAFADFTYWSCHLYLHTAATLRCLVERAGFQTVEIRQFQRYPLANHLHWLAKGKPGGQEKWETLNDPALNAVYARVLSELEKCDTLIGVFRLPT